MTTDLADLGIVRRHEHNPILSAADVPYESTLVFNAGVTRFGGRYAMVFRNDIFQREPELKALSTNLGLAFSDDGLRWRVEPAPCFAMQTDEVQRAYDPRLTVIDGRCYMCFAVDTRHGIRGGIAVTDDLRDFEVLSLSAPDNRNMVLFPRKIGGRYVRLERPFPIYSKGGGDRFDIWIADSSDLRDWGNQRLVLGCEQVGWCNNKIGPAAPPVETEAGWLTLIHAVDRDDARPLKTWERSWTKRYTVAALLLDRDDPGKVVGVTRRPIMVPDERWPYEIDGFRGSVLFPTGVIAEPDGELKIYYGASDTVMCLGTARAEELVSLCEPV